MLLVPDMSSYIAFWLLCETQVLQSVLPIKDEEVVLGQYEGYRDDPTVPDHSNTPTFATVVLRIHNERWEGMIYFTICLFFFWNFFIVQ
jgi:glucose-6-phosphate 1-dehydrogenase